MNSLNQFPLRTKSAPGITNLALVTVVSLVMVAILLTIQIMTLLNVRLAAINVDDKTDFYAAEGVLYDTIVRLNRGESISDINSSPDAPTSDIQIQRSTTQVGDLYQVDITANSQHASRRLFSSFRRLSSSPPTLDIALIIDSSGSMDDLGCRTCSKWKTLGHDFDCSAFPSSEKICQPIYAAQAAIQLFLDTLQADSAGSQAKVGLISYSTKAKVLRDLALGTASNYSQLTNKLQYIKAEGNTNIQDALQKAKDNLSWRSPSNTQRIVILLTDGIPNERGSGASYCSPAYPGYPDDHNPPSKINQCVQQAIDTAQDMKDNDSITIYAVGLGLESPHDYTQQKQIALAKFLLNNIVSSPPANYAHFTSIDQLQDLQNVYSEILHQILSNPYLRIRECPAGSTCP